MSRNDILSQSLYVRELRADDEIFVESDNWHNPILNAHESIAEIYISEGYINAALWMLSLIELSNDNGKKNSYIYPAMFCFRQYLELIMKFILRRHERYEGKEYKSLGCHDLVGLWNDIKSNIEQLDEEIEILDRLFVDLQEIDKNSFSFRYLTDKRSGERIKFSFKGFVDIGELKLRMLQLYRFFEGLHAKSYEMEDLIDFSI